MPEKYRSTEHHTLAHNLDVIRQIAGEEPRYPQEVVTILSGSVAKHTLLAMLLNSDGISALEQAESIEISDIREIHRYLVNNIRNGNGKLGNNRVYIGQTLLNGRTIAFYGENSSGESPSNESAIDEAKNKAFHNLSGRKPGIYIAYDAVVKLVRADGTCVNFGKEMDEDSFEALKSDQDAYFQYCQDFLDKHCIDKSNLITQTGITSVNTSFGYYPTEYMPPQHSSRISPKQSQVANLGLGDPTRAFLGYYQELKSYPKISRQADFVELASDIGVPFWSILDAVNHQVNVNTERKKQVAIRSVVEAYSNNPSNAFSNIELK